MADTVYIERKVKPFVLDWLGEKYSLDFRGGILEPPQGAAHGFDAIGFKERGDSTPLLLGKIFCSRPLTIRGAKNKNAIQKAAFYASVMTLFPRGMSCVLVFTNSELMSLVRERCEKRGNLGIEFLHCPLPAEMNRTLELILDEANREHAGVGSLKLLEMRRNE